MTVLDSFLTFARRLPSDRLEPIEAVLATLMDSHSEATVFNAQELAELDNRVAEPKPQYANPETIDHLLGRSRKA